MGLFSKGDPAEMARRAAAFMEQGRPKGAVGLYNQILKQDPRNRDVLNLKGVALNQMKKYNDTVTCSDRTLAVYPDDPVAYNNKGVALAELGDTQAAAECYDAAISSDPQYFESYFNKGVLLARLGDFPEALNLMEKAAKLKTKNPVPLLHKAIILGKMHQNRDALDILERLERRFGAHPDIAFQRGVQLAELGRYDQAIGVFEDIPGKHRDSAILLYSLSRCRAGLGEGEAALDLLGRAVSKDAKTIRAWAREENVFLPLRQDPRFRKMVKL